VQAVCILAFLSPSLFVSLVTVPAIDLLFILFIFLYRNHHGTGVSTGVT
jgi:hypothetical protein